MSVSISACCPRQEFSLFARRFHYRTAALLVLMSCSATAQQPASLELIEVKGIRWQETFSHDSQTLLSRQGVDFSAAGGVSALPILNGMMGNRIKILLDGQDIGTACANDMNPPLSYISGNQLSQVEVVAGISPVSLGGDNIAGVISISSITPNFSNSDSITHQKSYLGSRFQSNGDVSKISLGSEFASQQLSLSYAGSYSDANSYQDGAGALVPDTLYRAQNHQLVSAWQQDNRQLALKLTHQHIPFQGFANQYMDMTDNTSYGATLQYRQQQQDSEWLARAHWQQVSHEMGFFTAEKPGTMPMLTDSDDYSYQLHWRKVLNAHSRLLLGQEYYLFRLNDSWPAVPGSMMMGPNTYININQGKRQRVAAFAELNQQLTAALELNLGLRVEQVRTNTGDVQAYNPMQTGMMAADAIAAADFNARQRKQRDTLLDITASASYQLSPQQQLQLALAQKNRAPTLYERYSWGKSQMAANMIGWFGDGNGYIGDINLAPETARTLSASYQLATDNVQLQLTPYYSRVSDYIDVKYVKSVNSGAAMRHQLQFTNLDATLYGLDSSLLWLLNPNAHIGQWRLQSEVKLSRGTRDYDNSALYQQRPLHTAISVQHQHGQWLTALKWQWQASKTRVDDLRLENSTASYSLLDISTQWQTDSLTLSAGISNLLDKDYEQTLGGVNIASFRSGDSTGFDQLKGAGRSVELGLIYRF